MGSIQKQAFTDTIFLTYDQNYSFECGLQHTLEGRQVKMACDVPGLYHFIPI